MDFSQNIKLNAGENTIKIAANTPEADVGSIELWYMGSEDKIVDAYVNTFDDKQTIKGVGGAFTYYSDWLTDSPNKDKIYKILFDYAGLDIIRIKNFYGYSDDGTFSPVVEKEIVEKAREAAGKSIPVLLSSWSPAPWLKSNNAVWGKDKETGETATLKKNENGEYMYEELGKYYADAVKAYRDAGVNIDYLSIQNEPDFNADYEGCVYAAEETEKLAQYSKAFDATYEALQKIDNPPLLLGPDCMTANDAYITSMLNPSIAHGDGRVGAIGHHLYAGCSAENPDLYIRSMNNLRDNFPDTPKWQTEYYHGDFVQSAWLVSNTFVEEDAEAYIYWDTVWAAPGGLVGVEYPWWNGNWTYQEGYVVNDKLYAFAHFSKFTDSGYVRVDSSVDYQNNDIKISAFNSPGKDKLTLVLTNTKYKSSDIKLNLNGYYVDNSTIYLSTCIGENKKLMADEGTLGEDMTVFLPAQSVMTIDISGHQGAKPDKILKGEADPNSRTTKIKAKYGTPVIDGKADVIWNTIPYEKISQAVHGDHGAVGRFKTMWDKNNLYLLAYVNDDTINDASQQKDSVEIFINESNSKAAEYGAGDAQYIVNSMNEKQGGSGQPDINGFNSSVSRVDEGYIVEAAIPFRSISPGTRTKIGFDIKINDSHGTGGEMIDYISGWCDSGRETYKSLVNIGEIEFDIADIDNPYQRVEAEDWTEAGWDVRTEPCGDVDGGFNAAYIDAGDWIKYGRVDFGDTSPREFTVRAAVPVESSIFEIYIDDINDPNKLIGAVNLTPTGGWQKYATKSFDITGNVTGKHDVWFKIIHGGFNLNWWYFTNRRIDTVNIGAQYGDKDGVENADKDSKATAFITSISGNAEFNTITWTVTGKNEGEAEAENTLERRLETNISLNNSSLCIGLIVRGLYDSNAIAVAQISSVE